MRYCFFSLILSVFLYFNGFSQQAVWLDTDLMIGLPENAPREVDDAIALIMALKNPDKITIKGISTISYAEYGKKMAQTILKKFGNKNQQNIPIFAGANSANQLLVENEATIALANALKKQKLIILAIGPLTNIATVIYNHPELIQNINEIVVCAGRTAGHPFAMGTGNLVVWDYNFEYDVPAFDIILKSGVKLVCSGYEASQNLLLSDLDLNFLKKSTIPNKKWLYKKLKPWMNQYVNVFERPSFLAYDTTPLGHIIYPQFFKYQKNVFCDIVNYENDATVGPNLGKIKPHLVVANNPSYKYKVDFVQKTLPGFEEKIIEALKAN